MNKSGMALTHLMDEVEAQLGATVNFHDLSGLCLQIPDLTLRLDQHHHHGDYCAFAKRHGNQAKCAANKEDSIKRAQGGESFSGYCPFGVWDHAQPVRYEQEIIGIIYIGSLQHERTLAPISGYSYNGPALPTFSPELQERCRSMAAFLAEHVRLIVRAWIRQGNLLGKKKSEHFYLQAMHQFIETHYPKEISLQELADQLRVHANYLGTIISKLSKRTFRQHLLTFRCQQAQVLLGATRQSITEIAYLCGFLDSNYFSTAFKRETGQSPKAFRKQMRDIKT